LSAGDIDAGREGDERAIGARRRRVERKDNMAVGLERWGMNQESRHLKVYIKPSNGRTSRVEDLLMSVWCPCKSLKEEREIRRSTLLVVQGGAVHMHQLRLTSSHDLGKTRNRRILQVGELDLIQTRRITAAAERSEPTEIPQQIRTACKISAVQMS
jgi:hypothetical protein